MKKRWLTKEEFEAHFDSSYGWDDYEPERYGWEKSRIISARMAHNVEFAHELGLTSHPHRKRPTRKL